MSDARSSRKVDAEDTHIGAFAGHGFCAKEDARSALLSGGERIGGGGPLALRMRFRELRYACLK